MPLYLYDLIDRARQGDMPEERQSGSQRLPASLARVVERYEIRRNEPGSIHPRQR